MIRVMDGVKQPMKLSGKCLDPQLWHACAGGMVQMPALNSKVFYFPQGHAEHARGGNTDLGNSQIPALVLCRVSGIKYLADPETDEVYAKIRLTPVMVDEADLGEDVLSGNNGIESPEKPASFAKTLTQSDANNGAGFSVPRYCAETIFPCLDYSAEPPVQTILAKDVHGEIWKFRHIYRGTPRRHLLTTGWSHFVNQKKLVAGDSIVFFRAENGDLCVGIRRAKKGIGGGPEFAAAGWTGGSAYYSGYAREEEAKWIGGDLSGRVRPELVAETARLAAMGHPFEVVYFPRASTPEFFVKASAVRAAMQVQWCSGMRFKMAFETEDSSRISWFMGTISAVQVADPIRWPNSPWRLLQVSWDEPDLLQNVKRVNPWLVELVSTMPSIHLPPFSSPRKKMRYPPQHPEVSLMTHLQMPSLSRYTGIQGSRHAHLGLSSSHLRFTHPNPGRGPFPLGFHHPKPADSDNVSCLLSMGNSTDAKPKPNANAPQLVLFGQLILTEEQMSRSCSADTIGNSSSDGNPDKTNNCSDAASASAFPHNHSPDDWFPCYKEHPRSDETPHCKVFMESDDVGRTLDLSLFGTYEELYQKLANMFGITSSEMLSNLLYRDASGAVKHAGDEPFSEFLKTARRLTILTDSGSDNLGR